MSSKRRFVLLNNRVGNIGRWNNGRRVFVGHGVEETLSDKVSNGGNSIGLMMLGLLLKDVTGIGQGTKVALGITKVVKHVGSSAVDGRASVPEAEIGLTSKDEDICHVNQLL
jgi:hypothetical protein